MGCGGSILTFSPLRHPIDTLIIAKFLNLMSDVQGSSNHSGQSTAEEDDLYSEDFEVHGRYRDQVSGRFHLIVMPLDMQFVVERRAPRFAKISDIHRFYQSCRDLAPGFAYKLQLCLVSNDPRRLFVTLRCDEALFVDVVQHSESERKRISLSMSSDDPDIEIPRLFRSSLTSEHDQRERQPGWLDSMLHKAHLIHKCLENEFRTLGELPILPGEHALRSPTTPGFELWWAVSRLNFDGRWEDL